MWWRGGGCYPVHMFEDWGAEPSVPGGADGAGDGAPPEGFDGLEAVTAALSAVDVAILPTCPVTTTREALRALYEPSLAGTHQRIALTPCSDAFIRNDLVKAR